MASSISSVIDHQTPWPKSEGPLANSKAKALESELHDEMIRLFRLAGEGAGYWGTRYLQAVKRAGGLATAKRMLQPRNAGQRKGLDALLEAGKPELTLEALLLEDRFNPFFTAIELAEAQVRLGDFKVKSNKLKAERERLYPDEVEPGLKYIK